jgi:hypothetical protein
MKNLLQELIEAAGIACIFASPFIIYFLEMKP